MMDAEEQIARATLAKKILDNQEFKTAFDDVRAAIFQRIEDCPIRDEEGLRFLKLMLKALSDVRATLENRISEGTMASIRIQDNSQKHNFLGDMVWNRAKNR